MTHDLPSITLDAAEAAAAGAVLAVLSPLAHDDRRQALAFVTGRFKPRRAHVRAPDGLLTSTEAARKLGISIKTLDEHVAAGELRYIIIGQGKKRPRRRFADADVNEFITNQTRKESPCPSDATRARRSGNTISRSNVVGFSALQKRRRDAKPKR